MTQHTFQTDGPVEVSLRMRASDVYVTVGEPGHVCVDDDGADASEVTVEQVGSRIEVVDRRSRTWFLMQRGVRLTIVVPPGSRLTGRVGAGDISCPDRLAEVHVSSGSGDISVADIDGPATVRSGSGSLRMGRVGGRVTAVTGSGDIRIGRCPEGAELRAGSGDVVIDDLSGRARVGIGSGDIVIRRLGLGELSVTAGSGDARVAVEPGLPVWTDVTAAGGVTNLLTPRGAPTDQGGHAAVRARVGSGSVVLEDSRA